VLLCRRSERDREQFHKLRERNRKGAENSTGGDIKRDTIDTNFVLRKLPTHTQAKNERENIMLLHYTFILLYYSIVKLRTIVNEIVYSTKQSRKTTIL
jgi:hypothetical protein